MNEPSTVITDYALDTVSLVLAVRLFRPTRYWAGALFAASLAAFAGGTWHGFWQSPVLWKLTVILLGISSLFMMCGSIQATTAGKFRGWLTGIVIVKFMAYVSWMSTHDEFIYVLLDYAPAMLGVVVLHAIRRDAALKWMAAALLASVVGGVVQGTALTIHRHFNHNDLFHVIQIGVNILLYCGASRLREYGGNKS